ncbi:hypothetical protein PCANC_01402 [Puccinia coronata f. sp. avenae]|uniref:Uncharacterized protein n=1 Tax=Puccinia coronata f. sp. avenae TaxID=200324 RepID=A0A2N5W671_9BASI|nr:hypothetical protein PCANC_01402 [Puccinia coronata f. sp. avenae]
MNILRLHAAFLTTNLPITTAVQPDQMLSPPQVINRSTSAPLPMIKPLTQPAPAATPLKPSVTAPEAPGPAPVAERAQREPPHKKPRKSCPSPKVRRSQRVLDQRHHGLGSLMLPAEYLGVEKLAIEGVSKTKHSRH